VSTSRNRLPARQEKEDRKSQKQALLLQGESVDRLDCYYSRTFQKITLLEEVWLAGRDDNKVKVRLPVAGRHAFRQRHVKEIRHHFVRVAAKRKYKNEEKRSSVVRR
jgi:hypothetical protein